MATSNVPVLSPVEARVLGVLIEKQRTVPDTYPLTLNSLINACNQKSSREPVLELDRNTVHRTVNDLVTKRLIMVTDFGGRVDKYQQRFCNTQFATLKFSPAEFAVVTLLLLRGPQTPGEIKAHSGRLHEFADGEADACLDALMTRQGGPYVARLPREPRRKDHAYAHLFSGPVESAPKDMTAEPVAEAPDRPAPVASDTRAAAAEALRTLETRVATLEGALNDIKRALGID